MRVWGPTMQVQLRYGTQVSSFDLYVPSVIAFGILVEVLNICFQILVMLRLSTQIQLELSAQY